MLLGPLAHFHNDFLSLSHAHDSQSNRVQCDAKLHVKLMITVYVTVRQR